MGCRTAVAEAAALRQEPPRWHAVGGLSQRTRRRSGEQAYLRCCFSIKPAVAGRAGGLRVQFAMESPDSLAGLGVRKPSHPVR